MVYVASRWTSASYLDVLVFSNCERVKLLLNGELVGDTPPSRTSVNQHLAFPPFVFEIEQFHPGRLDAVGYIGDEAVATHWVATPGEPARVVLTVDDDGIAGDLGASDVLLAHARIVDTNGVLCKRSSLDIAFSQEGGVEIVGPTRIAAESGVASVVLRRPPGCGWFRLVARNVELGSDNCEYRVEPAAEIQSMDTSPEEILEAE